jgi:hypothetical protein
VNLVQVPARRRRSAPPADRFARKVRRGGPDECWPFTGSTDKFGHGQFHVSVERGRVPAHVFALELALGIPCPPGREGCHHCDNPPCCNPVHVYYGTRQQNVDDKVRRGRHIRGEACTHARLSESDVVAIRTRFAAGVGMGVLVRDYGLSSAMVSLIVNGKRWAHVGGPIRTHNRPGRRPARKAA